MRSFRDVDLTVQVLDPDRRIAAALRWRDGLLIPAEVPGEKYDLTIEGDYGLAVRYLTGAVWSDVLFARARVRGDVFALSALHGLTHHPAVAERWRDRIAYTEQWLRFVEIATGAAAP